MKICIPHDGLTIRSPPHEDPLATVPLQARVVFQAEAVVVAVWANATEKADTSTPKTHAL